MSESEDLYIELLNRTLTFSLWPEPPVPVGYFSRRTFSIGRSIARGINSCLARSGKMLAQIPGYTDEERESGVVWPGYADTMVGMLRLNNLEFCIRQVLKDEVEGDFIETGVWRGGCCIFMRGLLKALDVTDRRVFVADSFEGLPQPDPTKYQLDKGDAHYRYDYLAVSEESVRHNFERYGLLDDQVVFLKGFFADTLPGAQIERLAVMRLDGDMYGSTTEALNSLYSKLSPGGFCIIDDYCLPACRQAVQDFRKANDIQESPETIDRVSKFWRKKA